MKASFPAFPLSSPIWDTWNSSIYKIAYHAFYASHGKAPQHRMSGNRKFTQMAIEYPELVGKDKPALENDVNT